MGDTCVVVMGDFNGHVGFLGEQEKNYDGGDVAGACGEVGFGDTKLGR